MKKVYTKPEIIFENFSMSTNIAGDCEKIVGSPSKDSCGVGGSAPFTNLFSNIDLTSATACHIPGDKNYEDYDGFCYYNPSDNYELFNS